MKTVFKKSIALVLLTSTLASQAFGASEVTATPAVEETQVAKTKLQKLGNLGAAMTRGALRGFASGMASRKVFRNNHTINLDALSDFAAELLPIPALTDAMFINIDDTQAARIVEQIAAAFAHAACFIDARNHDYHHISGCFISRIVKGLNVRNTSKVQYWCTMIARFITESVNNYSFVTRGHELNKKFVLQTFRPLVGLAAVARTMWIEKIIDNRITAGIITEAQANRTRTILNAFIGMPLNALANWINMSIAQKCI